MGQMLTIPYARQRAVDNSDYIRAMSEMMLRRGDILAEAARARGAANMAAWGNVGNVIGNTFLGIGQQRDQELKLKTLKDQQDVENALRQREFEERRADRQADLEWRQKQYETEQSRYADTVGDREADQIEANVPVPKEAMRRILGTAAEGRFKTLPGQEALPAWEAPAEGDAMADAGPATEAVPMSYMRNPTGQERLALQAAKMAAEDRVARDRQFTISQGAEDERARNAQANADRNFNEGRRQFGITESRLEKNNPADPYGLAQYEGLAPDEILAKLPPSKRAMIESLTSYRSDVTKITSMRGNQRMEAAQLAMMVDPTWDMSQYATRAKLRADFTSGKTATNLKSVNQLVGHLSDLEAKATALGNTNYPLWNAAKNEWNKQTGRAEVNNFATVANAVDSEMAAVFKGAGATDQEIAAWREVLHSQASPAQLAGFVKTSVGLMGSRLGAVWNQYEQGMGRPKDFNLLSEKTRKTLDAWGFPSEEFEPRAAYRPGETTVDSDTGDFDFFNTVRRREEARRPQLTFGQGAPAPMAPPAGRPLFGQPPAPVAPPVAPGFKFTRPGGVDY